ncbi:hypothetical protein [Brachybacterium alimentarium]|uniref:hypothetical protein n=1 Tax=Brachybacterium alimentarium TaxID=47845 RepID=UPI000DF1EFD0|nr:hypothetical protein [Brachybacterium alimentarium]RCS82610.1 hypothetical protein CIK67_13685 [Brachybacterium alimentarium]
MNPNEHDHEHAARRETPQATRPEPVERAMAPDAIAAADVDRTTTPDAEGADPDPALRKARGVDWVRSSDLLARGSGVASRLAIDFEAHLAHKAHDPLARGARQLGQRMRELPPVSAFGRSTGHEGAGRGPVGMS